MILQRWNYDKHEYEAFNSPAVILSLYSEDMLEEVDCASCGKRMPFGDGYTSKEIHNRVGLGYPVCSDCYEAEIKRWEQAKDES